MNNWTNEELLDQIITKANQIRIISESNDLADMRSELLHRLKLAEGEREEYMGMLDTIICSYTVIHDGQAKIIMDTKDHRKIIDRMV